jgi:uracil-DNA glycosylase
VEGPSHRVPLFKVPPEWTALEGRTGPESRMSRQTARVDEGSAVLSGRIEVPTVGAEWGALCREIRSCQNCHLARTRTHAVAYRGGRAPRVVFVGEAPGAAEDRVGLPFVGRSGAKLDRAIAEIGLDGADFGIFNVIKCRPPGNKFDRVAERACRPYLDRQLSLLRPQVVVPLGRIALRAIDPHAPPLLESAGRPLSAGPPAIFPMLHPAATFRSTRMAQRWQHDVAELGSWLKRVPAK